RADLSFVDVDADHLETRLSELDAERKPDVAQAHDTDPRGSVLDLALEGHETGVDGHGGLLNLRTRAGEYRESVGNVEGCRRRPRGPDSGAARAPGSPS